MDSPPRERGWTIYSRTEITKCYEICERIGAGTYAEVYRGVRKSDGLTVALKEVHHFKSALREIKALQALNHSPHVVHLYEYFWMDDEDAVLVLEFLATDLSTVILNAKKAGGMTTGEIKRWMIQILEAVDVAHQNSIVHRDLKPSNLLVSVEGVLKLGDFGQSRILEDTTRFSLDDKISRKQVPQNKKQMLEQPDAIPKSDVMHPEGSENQGNIIQEPRTSVNEEGYMQELDVIKNNGATDETDEEPDSPEGDTSFLVTCNSSIMYYDRVTDPIFYEYQGYESLVFTCCIGTRWFRAPELLYGSFNYGQEIDLWSLGCIFAELLSLEPLFPGTSDIDQLSRIINVLGNLTKEAWPDCWKLRSYEQIHFEVIEKPLGLGACLANRSTDEIRLVERLICYDPMRRATAMELLQDTYFTEKPLPVSVNELKVPARSNDYDERTKDLDSDTELDSGDVCVTTTDTGFSICFS